MPWWKDYPWRMVQTLLRETDMADIDAVKYAEDLKNFGATVVTLNAGGILANYPSKLDCHTVNPYLTGSSLKDIVDACHKRGIRVIARTDFSKIPYALYEKHPQWAFRTADGGIIEQNGFVQTCQNSEYQREKVPEILREMFTAIPFDGLYCNMSGFFGIDYKGNKYGLCTCDSCRKAYKSAFGADVPAGFDISRPEVMKYLGFQAGMGKRLRESINACLKAISPEIAVDKVDYLRTESHTDIGENLWIYSASSNSRISSGSARETVSDNAGADFMAFRYRESSVSPALLKLRQWQNLANSGNVSVFFLGRPDNHKDLSFYGGTKRVFDFHRLHEDELRGLKSGAKVLLIEKSQAGREDPEAYGWIRALSASHIPFDEIRSSALCAAAFEGKEAAVLPDVKDLGPSQIALIDAFCEKGGTVVSSGDSGMRGRIDSLKCLGAGKILEKRKDLLSTVFAVEKEDEAVFARSAESPYIAIGSAFTQAEFGDGVKKYLTLLPEPMFGPPEVCYVKEKGPRGGVCVNEFGAGKGICIPWCCGSFYHTEGYLNTLNLMQDVLFGLCGLEDIAPALHPSVELVSSVKGDKRYLSLINASGFFGNSVFEPVPMYGIEIRIPGVKKARCLNNGSVDIQPGGILLNRLDDFEMIEMEV